MFKIKKYLLFKIFIQILLLFSVSYWSKIFQQDGKLDNCILLPCCCGRIRNFYPENGTRAFEADFSALISFIMPIVNWNILLLVWDICEFLCKLLSQKEIFLPHRILLLMYGGTLFTKLYIVTIYYYSVQTDDVQTNCVKS